jgi:hypothetical protein
MPTEWIQKGQALNGEAAGDRSGQSVSFNAGGNIVAIGAPYNSAKGYASGQVRVYKYNSVNTTWEQVGQDIDGEAAGDLSGFSVSLSAGGSIVAIGARYNDGNGNSSGHVRVYKYNSVNTTWEQVGQDIDGETKNDQSGYSVSLSADGNIVAIGAVDNDGNGSISGHVRVYSFTADPTQSNGGTWNQVGQDIDGETKNDYSGRSVSLSADGTIVAIGAPGNDGNGSSSGHVRVYSFTADSNQTNGGTWNKVGQDIDGEAAGDGSGYSVSLSADGTIVAIGAPGEVLFGDSSGQVRVYKWDGLSWEQVGQDIDGEAGDERGYSVSLSADGTIVAIGAPLNDANGDKSGQVRVYYINSLEITSNAIFNVVENQQSIGQVIATDADGAALTYTITGSEITIDAAGNLSFVNTNGADFETKNSYTATVTVSDGTNSTSQEITVDVINVNDVTPTIGIRIIREKEGVVKPGESISYEIVVETDVFGDIATITSEETPAWLRLTDNGDNTASLVGTAEEKGEYNFRIGATVGILTRVEEIELEVVSDNLSVNAARALASIQLQIQEGVDATKGKLLLQILGTILQNNREVDNNGLIIQMIAKLNGLLNRM